MSKPMTNHHIMTELLERHKGILFKISYSYCRDAESRKDLIQEIAIQIWKSLHRFDDQFKESTWIYRIALNVAISQYRKEKTRSHLNKPWTASILEIAEDVPMQDTDRQVQMLYAFIDELDALNKALILLYLDRHSHREIADILGITETNVATKIGRVKEKLSKKFSQIKAEEE